VALRLVALAALVAFTLVAQEPYSAPVIGIADGDTISVLYNGQRERIRLWGIDAPEKRQVFGTKAKRFMADLAFGKTVSVQPMDIDRWQRTVAIVILPDGRNLNREIVRAGLAWWYERYAPGDAELERLEIEARRARRGLWTDPDPMPPWECRKNQRASRQASAIAHWISMAYDDMDQLEPCAFCGCPLYWLCGQRWRCVECVPLLIENPITFEVRTEFVRSEPESDKRAA
jgi:endonuclease YncB( thermonuclease family)